MADQELIINKIAQSLLYDYSAVYYVNAVTNQYEWYSVDKSALKLVQQASGEDFFQDLIVDCEDVIYEEDKHIFKRDIQKENLLRMLDKGEMQSIVYRLLVDGEYRWHSLRVVRGSDSDYFILGIIDINDEVLRQKEQEKLQRENEAYSQIAEQLAEHYSTIFYVDAQTDNYVEFSSTDIYRTLEVPAEGNSFFVESQKNAQRVVHPDDRATILELFDKDRLIEALSRGPVANADYRLIIGEDKYLYLRLSAMYTKDKKHFLFCTEDRNEEVETERMLEEEKRKNVTYSQIAESLAANYDTIYYVDINTDHYTEFVANDIYKSLHIPNEGESFFEESKENSLRVVHPDDYDLVAYTMDKKYLLEVMKDKKIYSIKYRLIIQDKIRYTRLAVIWARDRQHLIVGVEDIDEVVRKEERNSRALRSAEEKATRDELTGVKNKNAYQETEKALQGTIDEETETEFAIVVCDMNNLKQINDTMGHRKGDEYLREACRMICYIFKHSPVFRVGGDEFVVVLSGEDYDNRSALMEELERQSITNRDSGNAPVLAAGVSEYIPNEDKKVFEIFNRADNHMYENKKRLKGLI